MQATTVRLDVDIDPVLVGARSGLLWSRPGLALAGVGEAARVPVAQAPAALASWVGPDELHTPGSGPVAFAALPFDPTAAGDVIVPAIIVGRSADGPRWLTVVGDAATDPRQALDRVQECLHAADAAPEPTELRLHAPVDPLVWRDEIVGAARDLIRAGRLDKAVLARELLLEANAPIHPARVVARLRASHPAALVFLIDGFVGASPELLVSRTDDVVRSHPLAGTAPRHSDPARDQQLAATLLGSAKDRGEHRITIDWLLDALLPYCSYVDAEPEPGLVTLANVHHLGTRVEGRLSHPPAHVLDLVRALHPTPAVGGDPQQEALAVIAELERAHRGRYAGPVGWFDADGNGAFAVGIRSAQLDGCVARLFAGVGVVTDSDPDAELAETRAKFQAMLSALVVL